MPRAAASLSALYFNNSGVGSAAVTLANIAALQGLTAVTVESWVMLTGNTTNTSCIFQYYSGNAGIEVLLFGGTIRAHIGNSTTSVVHIANDKLSSNVWHLIETSWDGSTVRLFIDGVLQSSPPALSGGNTGNPGVAPVIGNQPGGGQSWQGVISCTRISNTARHTASYTVPTSPFTNNANVVGLYCFTDSTGTVARDSSVNANNGTLGGSPLPIWSPGLFGNGISSRTNATNRVAVQDIPCSLSFNGTNTSVTSNVLSGLSAGFSIFMHVKLLLTRDQALWVNTTNLNDRSSLSIINGVFSAGYYNGSSFVGAVYSSVRANLTTWVDVLYTFDGSTGNIFINGVDVTLSGSNTPATASIANTHLLASRAGGSPLYARCMMINRTIFNRKLTSTEAMSLHCNYNYNIPTGVIDMLRLQEGAGTTAYDSSGNGNNGTITSGTFVADTPSKKREVAV